MKKNDPSNMKKLILEFPQQVEEAITIGKKSNIQFPITKIQNIIITGLGGSAIGGDLLRSYLTDECKIPISVNRHYYLPNYVDEKTLVIVSSYSGNTEETIAAYKYAIKKKAKILCITSGGVVKAMAEKYKHPFIQIPGGLPPRAAVGYSFFPLLITIAKLGFVKSKEKEIQETVHLLQRLSKKYRSNSNPALALAKKLKDKLPIIYSAADKFDAVNVRWRGQITENAKTLSFGHVFPELNHNEIVGWEVLQTMMKKMHIIILRDREDYKRIQLRMDITKHVIKKFPDGITEIYSEGESLLARIFSLLYLGDWLSYYLAMHNTVDPTPVTKITLLKNELEKIK